MVQTTLPQAETDPLTRYGRSIAEYVPLITAYHYHMSKSKFRWMFGGNRSSKTHSATMDCAMFALGLHPARRTPENAVIWVATVNWEMIGEICWGEKLSEMIPWDKIAHISWHNKGANIPRMVRLINGNRIVFKAFEQGREAFQGKSIHACYCDEQAKSDSQGIFREIQARLVDTAGFYSHSMTPLIPCPWLEERIESPTEADEFFYADLNDNRESRGGYIQDAEIDLMIADWPEEVQETRIKGLFASFEGVVYKSFSRKTHVIPHFEIPEDWARYRGIDFGYSNPFACVWMARSPDREWHVYQEHHERGMLLAQHRDIINAKSGAEQYVFTCADHDPQDAAELAALGIETVPARKSVLAGIEAVQAAMKIRSNGKPRLFFHDNCPVSIVQHAGYRWPEGTDRSDPKEQPIKKNDHLVDPTRYIIFAVEGKSFFSEDDLA